MQDDRLTTRLSNTTSPEPPEGLEDRLLQSIPDRLGSRRVRTPALMLVAAAAAAVVALVATLSTPDARADVLQPIVEATLQTPAVHVVMLVHTREGEDFGYVDLDAPATTVEAWVEPPTTGRPGRTRIEKAGRIQIFDGSDTVHHHPERREAFRTPGGGIELSLLSPVAWVEQLLESSQRVEPTSWEEQGSTGTMVLHFDAPDLAGRRPAFFDDYERRVELGWDLESHQLTAMVQSVRRRGQWEDWSVVVSLDHAASWPDALFEVPEGVHWPTLTPASPELDSLPPREAARRLLSAAIDGDWDQVRTWTNSASGVQAFRDQQPSALLELGEPFRSGTYAGVYVPYRVRVDGQEHAADLALRNDNAPGRWVFDGGY